jgi:hypothetical protein
VTEIIRFENYAIRITAPHKSSLDFEVKQILGDAIPNGEWLYEIEGSMSSAETTTNFDEGEIFLTGSVRQNGCSNWDFNTREIQWHFCDRESAAGVGRLLDHLYQVTTVRLDG